MLTIVVLGKDYYDEASEKFVTLDDVTLELEHSLVSLSKWESKFEKPFLGGDKSGEEVFEYIKIMTLTPNVPDEVFHRLSSENVDEVNNYINAKMTATWFNERPGSPRSREVVTAELIYHWLTVFQIPFECENWHLNRLFTLIRVCEAKQEKPKKMSKAEIAARNRDINARRRKELGTKG